MPVVGNNNRIFYAYATPSWDINTGFDGHYHAALQDALNIFTEFGIFMYFQTNAMASAISFFSSYHQYF